MKRDDLNQVNGVFSTWQYFRLLKIDDHDQRSKHTIRLKNGIVIYNILEKGELYESNTKWNKR